MLESKYKAKLFERIQDRFPGSVILKTDPHFLPGIPDNILLHGPQWAFLEVKKSASARREPNQEYYVDLFDEMSFASFIHPQNEVEVLNALQRAWRLDR